MYDIRILSLMYGQENLQMNNLSMVVRVAGP